jgi:serine/threonine-protein kinase
LFTGQPPPEAKQRFLNPDSLVPLRHLNPKVSPEIERAVLWAMALHPNDRPATIRVFRESLLGDNPPLPPSLPSPRYRKIRPSIFYRIAWPERILAGLAAVLFILAFAANLFR